MSSKNQRKKNITDKNTDYLFDYFMNEDKFNDQLRGEWDEQMEKKLENHKYPNLDSRIMTDRIKSKEKESSTRSSDKELPTSENESESSNSKPDVEFNDDDSGGDDSDNASDSSIQSSAKSPYGPKIEAKPKTDTRPKSEGRPRDAEARLGASGRGPKELIPEKPLLGETLVADIQKYIETPEERRARAREEYSKLQDLVEKYGVKLSKPYTIDDDPDELRAEYDMLKERRHKNNQVKFYKSILLNIVCGVEFLNEKYNPFEFKLRDWSKQIAADMDDYSEVLEEIYEKYKDRGGKMAPEIRLLFLIIMSGVTYHLSQALFGSGGLDNTIKNNPNIIGKLLGGLVKGGLPGMGGNDHEPPEAKEPPRDNKNILASIRKYNQTKQSDVKTETQTTTDAKSENNSNQSQALTAEREKRLLAEQEAKFQERLRKQNELHAAEVDRLRIQQIQSIPQQQQQVQSVQQQYPNNYLPQQTSQTINQPVNQVLSGIGKKPRFMLSESQSIVSPRKNTLQELSDELDIFDSEIKDIEKTRSHKFIPNKKPSGQSMDELIESLEGSTDDIDEIIESSEKKKTNKPTISIRKPRNSSATKSATKSAGKRRGTDSASDALSSSKRNHVVRI